MIKHHKISPSIVFRRALWARDISGRLLGIDFLGDTKARPNYQLVQEAFLTRFQQYSSIAINKPGHQKEHLALCNDQASGDRGVCLIDKNHQTISNYYFPNKSGFSKWLSGKNTPSNLSRKIANQLFEGIDDLWFGNNDFSNRITRFLSVLDLAHQAKQHLSSRNQLEVILSAILTEWRPKRRNDWEGNYDFFIPGPKERVGPIPRVNADIPLLATDNLFAKSRWERSIIPTREHNERMKTHYDLSIGPRSFVGVDIPKDIADMFDIEKPCSISKLLLIVMGSELIDHDSGYQDDLIIDYLAALICCSVLGQYNKVKDPILGYLRYCGASPYSPIFSEFFFGTDPDLYLSPRTPLKNRKMEPAAYSAAYDYRDLHPRIGFWEGHAAYEAKSDYLRENFGCSIPLGQDFHLAIYDRLWVMRDRYLNILGRSGLKRHAIVKAVWSSIENSLFDAELGDHL